jgi:alcohol dehydrogenase class IV
MQRFTLPRDLYHGKGALEALKSLKGKKAIVCVGGGIHEAVRLFGQSSRLSERGRNGSPGSGRN